MSVRNKIETLEESKKRKVLSIMMALLILGIVVNIIMILIPTKEEKFNIPVRSLPSKDPYPSVPNSEINLGNSISKLQELKEIEKEINLLYLKEELTTNDSIKLLDYYQRLESLRK